ncbi:MAG: peptidylprolyl isomerase [Burkholderiales bacterium]|nr:peptidylprolyl isomerase [Opitutaceae bacterium]
MHLTARLGLALLALSPLALLGQSAADIAKFGVTVPTTGLVPAVVEGQALTALDRNFAENTAPISVDLRPRFTITGLRGAGHELAQFRTSLGTFNIEFLADGTDAGAEDLDPHVSVNNFKNYVSADASSKAIKAASYDRTFFHRSVDLGNFFGAKKILQGGGYKVDPKLSAIPKKPAIVREFRYANTRGTLSMARTDEPNTATSEWFFNLNDNTSIFNAGDPASSADDNTYAVFARVLGNGMSVVDRIGALPTYDLGGAFGALPLRDNAPGQSQLLLANLVAVDSVRLVPLQPADTGKGTSVLTYSFTNDNPSAATVTLSPAGRLLVTKAKRGGRALITVRASEAGGASVTSTLTVTHPGPPIVVKQLPAKTTAALGTNPTLTADITAWPLTIKWQSRPSPTADWQDLANSTTEAPTPYSGVATEYLTIALPGNDTAKSAASLALHGHQYRFIVSNTFDGVARSVEGAPTTLQVIPTLAFTTQPVKTTTADLGATFQLRATAAPATLPAPAYQWQRKGPAASDTWVDLVDAKAAVIGTGTAQNPQTPAVLSPYSGAKTTTLTVRLTGNSASSGTGLTAAQTLALHKNQFRCVISHDRGTGTLSVLGTPTTLTVKTLPVRFATQPPKLFTGALDASASVSVTAAGAAANTPYTYQWQRLPAGQNPKIATNWVNLASSTTEAPTRYNGVTTRTLAVSLAAVDDTARYEVLALTGDQYRCIITNLLGTTTSTPTTLGVLAQSFSVVTQENLSVFGLEAATGRTFSAKGLPKGLRLDPATGRITGIATAPFGAYGVVVTIRQAGAATITRVYYLEVRSLSGDNAGGFEAFVFPTAEDAPPSGKFALLVAANGTFTGSLTTAEDKLPVPFKGALVRDPATGALSLAAPLRFARPGPPSGRSFVLDFDISPTGVLVADLDTKASASAPPLAYAITADALLPGVQIGAYSASNRAPWAVATSRYTLAFTDPVDLAGDDTRPRPPTGGHATGTIAADGTLALTGKTGDGQPLTASLAPGENRSYRLFLRNQHTGAPGAYLSAQLALTGAEARRLDTDALYTRYSAAAPDRGEVYWHKPALPSSSNYRQGFGPLGLTLRMEPWGPGISYKALGAQPEGANKGKLVLNLTSSSVDNTATNPRTLPLGLTIADNGSLKATTLPDASSFALQLNFDTGAFTGTFTLTDPTTATPPANITRTVQVEGVFLQLAQPTDTSPFPAPDLVMGEGLFLVPAFNPTTGATTGDLTAGRIQFQTLPAPAP